MKKVCLKLKHGIYLTKPKSNILQWFFALHPYFVDNSPSDTISDNFRTINITSLIVVNIKVKFKHVGFSRLQKNGAHTSNDPKWQLFGLFWLLDTVTEYRLRDFKRIGLRYQWLSMLCKWKLDGAAPLITDPPPTSFTTLSTKKNKKNTHTESLNQCGY